MGKISEEKILLPPVPPSVYTIYVKMRETPRQMIAKNVLPGIFAALAAYGALDDALNNPKNATFGEYQATIKTQNDKEIALVAPYIAQLQTLFATVQAITAGIDAASIADGGDSIFNTQID